MPPIAIVEAPSILGLRPTGVEHLPTALLEAGLATRLDATLSARVTPPPYQEARDGRTGLRNAVGIAEYARKLADAVERVLSDDRVPLVLGGDCSILLGNLLALRRRGRFGLLFLDGHADFYQLEANVGGEAASSELAFATGRGPEVVTRFDGFHPLVRDEDVVVFGHRDAKEAESYGSQPLPRAMLALDLQEVRQLGAGAAATRAVEHLTMNELDGFWVHLDADVLDDEAMPFVDYRLDDGLGWDELCAVLSAAARSGRMAGMDVTIYNPRLDTDGAAARQLVQTLGKALA